MLALEIYKKNSTLGLTALMLDLSEIDEIRRSRFFKYHISKQGNTDFKSEIII